MQLLLVRHGNAGSKVRWKGADRERPLSTKGKRQSQWLADTVVPMAPSRIVTSPYVRCLQTIEPLAAKLDLKPKTSPDLVPDAGDRALALVERLGRSRVAGDIVVCTHGEVLGEVLQALSLRSGLKLQPRPPGQKGCLWVIELKSGRLQDARYFPPPG
ncbi:MAG TPA: phosphoglycerate mutase family protein [Acidimicrobiales bacterium]|nr:phosphoglycerate mutase family protein [Acidimicrobiales bacterium]